MAAAFSPRLLGRTGFTAGPLGLGSSYGIGAQGVEEAFARGVNYFYWAWLRAAGMRQGLRHILKQHREQVFVTITSLLPTETPIRYSVNRARRALGTDYIDGLQFYLLQDRKPWSCQLEPALKLKAEGIVRHLGATGHHRPNFAKFCREPFCEFFHVRYNAVHRGAETEVFPQLPPRGAAERPGVVAFTATCWRQLLKASPAKLDGLPAPTAGDCYRFALSHPDVDVCLTGPADDAQLRHALDAVARGPMAADELEWMRAVGERLRKRRR